MARAGSAKRDISAAARAAGSRRSPRREPTREFVAVGFGLVVSPIEEDREEMISEARALGRTVRRSHSINRLSAGDVALLLSDFTGGYDELGAVRREIGETAVVAADPGRA